MNVPEFDCDPCLLCGASYYGEDGELHCKSIDTFGYCFQKNEKWKEFIEEKTRD